MMVGPFRNIVTDDMISEENERVAILSAVPGLIDGAKYHRRRNEPKSAEMLTLIAIRHLMIGSHAGRIGI